MELQLVPPKWPEYRVPLDPWYEWTPIDRNAPIAYVRLRRNRYGKFLVNQWEVIRCPYCGGKHTHSAGDEGDDPRTCLGGRIAHCEATPECDEYRLVEWTGQGLPPGLAITRTPIRRVSRAAVWKKTGGRCWYCGTQTVPYEDFRIDHVQPVSRGGSDDVSNLVPCCNACNASKSAVLIEEFRSRCPYPRSNDNCFWFEVEDLTR